MSLRAEVLAIVEGSDRGVIKVTPHGIIDQAREAVRTCNGREMLRIRDIIEPPEPEVVRREDCETCDGDGHFECDECGGSGQIKCLECVVD